MAVPALVVAWSLVGAPPSLAQTPLYESGEWFLGASGYVRSLTGVTDAGFEPPSGDRHSGFHGNVARLKLRGRWGDGLVLDVHSRVQVTVTSAEDGLGGSAAGFGVSADPGRAIDLESVWIEEDRLRAWHDVDRLAMTAYTSVADITVGRQAITWGTSFLFPVADLWAQFSPFELDTEEKPGVDAVRVLSYPTPDIELDAVLADRGDRDDGSAGIRATWSLPSADVYGAIGRVWEEVVLIGGLSWLFDSWKLRIEGVAARDQDEDLWLDPRGTIGADWIGSHVTFSVEYHRNGLGASDAEDYAALLQGERFARGESYFLGRNYLGGVASWAVDDEERIRISGSVLVNLDDPSGAIFPAVSWDVSSSTSIGLGGLLAFGDAPEFLGEIPILRSEYGTYGDLLFGQVAVYF